MKVVVIMGDSCLSMDLVCSVVIATTEEVHTHVNLFFFLFFLLSGRSTSSSGSTTTSSSGSGSSGSLEGFSLRETIIGGERDGGKVLEGAHYEVGDSRLNDVSGTERDSGSVGNTSSELLKDGLGGNREDSGVEDLSVLEDVVNVHLVFERSDLQFIEESSLTGGDLVAFLNDIEVVDDFNLGLDNLGSNTEVTEETSLSGIKSGGSSLDSDTLGGKRSDLSGGFSDLGVEDGEDISKVSVGEDDGGVALELLNDLIEVVLSNPVTVGLLSVGSVSLGRRSVELGNSLLHLGVLTADESSSNVSHLSSHDANLLGGDVVSVDEHHLGELRASILAFFPELVLSGLGLLFGTHV